MNCPSCQAPNEPSLTACARCGATLVAPTSVLVSVDLKQGTLFHGRYEILGPLGRGGMGMVYKAHDRTLDETVAIKILRPDFAEDPKMAERFRSEIKLARKVRHRNVCTIHDYGQDHGLLYISMELIEGVDLKRILREKGALPPEEAYAVAIQMAEGLQAVHDAGIIHRDLKTPNIMRDAQGLARLMDFGVAKRHGAEGTATATGHIVGTPEYMSPEQAQGQKVDFRSDIYALGVVIYEMFTGHVPFRGETPISTILKHLHDPPPLDGAQAATIPATLKPVLRKALAKEPAYRYPTAAALADALRQARTPSLRQQRVATEVLEAPTVDRARAVAGAPAGPRTLYHRRAWLGIVGVAAIAVSAVSLQLRRPAFEPRLELPEAAPPSTSTAAGATPASAPPPVAAGLSPATAPPATAPPAAAPATAPPAAAPAPKTATAPAVEGRSLPAIVATPRAPTPTPKRAAAPVAMPPAPTPLPTAAPTAAPAVTVPPAGRTESPEPQGTGLLLVVARPWGNVRVDGTGMGTTPLDTISLKSGVHTVVVQHPSYEPIERKVTIRAGQTERLVVDFAAQGTRKQP
jgi:eukaryotic-like serine/threonine-protein kinase